VIGGLGWVCLAAGGWAEEPSDDAAEGGEGPAATARAEVLELDPFAVEAHAVPWDLQSYAGSAEVLTRGELGTMAVRSLAEALEVGANIPFQSFAGNAAGAAPDLRGYGENGALRTLILVDGLPLNRADMGSPSWLEVPLGRIERVEVLRGPQSARFGDYATGGVINIVTRLDPRDAPESQAEVGVGSDGDRWLRWHHSRPLAGGALAAAAEHGRTDGYRENGGYTATSLGLNYARTWEEGPTARWGLFYLDDRVEFPGPLVGPPGGGFPENPRRSAYGASAPDFFSDNRKADLSLALALPSGPAGRGECRAGLSWRELRPNQGIGSHTTNDQRSAWVAPSWRWSPRPGWSAMAGLSGRETRLQVDRFADLARTRRLARARLTKENAALFASLDLALGDAFSLSLAARGEWHRLAARIEGEDFDGTHRGSAAQVGLLWRPAPGLRAWGRYDRLFRFPVTDEVAAYQGFALNEPFNAEIGPERGHNLETGVEWSGRLGTLSMNAFVQDLDGEIAFDYRRNLNLNLADSRRQGLEWSVRTRWQGWELRAAYTWLQAVYRGEAMAGAGGVFDGGQLEGKRVPLVAPHVLSATLTSPSWRGARFTAEGLYRHRAFEGSDYANSQSPLPGWTVLNLAARVEIGRHGTLFARLNNVFDRDYATLKFFGGWYPAPGRQARLGLTWDY
jgi:iron complex outermembrane recepter protein